MSGGDETRRRIMRAARALAQAEGGAAVAVDAVLARAGVGEHAFRRHFRGGADLAEAVERLRLEEETWAEDAAFARARDLAADPLRMFLLGLRFLAEASARTPPPARFRFPARRVRDAARRGALRRRSRFRAMFEEIAAVHPPREPISAEDLADMVATALEGALALGATLDDPALPARQIMVLRANVRRLFAPAARAGGTAREGG